MNFPPLKSPFLFTTCQVGAEATLKKEISKKYPELKFAYSRPGFVTFKSQTPLGPDFELHSIFARSYGLSFGKVKDGEGWEEALRFFEQVKADAHRLKNKHFVRLHFWERDQHKPGDEPLGFTSGNWLKAQSDELVQRLKDAGLESLFEKSPTPKLHDTVVDCISIEENEWWYGLHLHHAKRTGTPGEQFEISMPQESPSRAYIKLEEALAWSRLELKAGETAVEIGSAPGGASYALLKRGLNVVGIDPGEMDPVVLKHPKYKHFSLPVARVPREDLPKKVDWLLMDMNIDPRVALFQVDRLGTRLRDTLRGTVLTIKLNQWKIAEDVPYFFEHLQAIGFTDLQATQLPSNRQEIVIVGRMK